MRPTAEFLSAAALGKQGLSDGEIARRTGIPRQTLGYWRRSGSPRHARRLLACPDWRPANQSDYSYVLGLYLGDGHIVRRSRYSSFMRLTLDLRYPAIIAEAAEATSRLLGGVAVASYRYGTREAVILQASHPVLPYAFPQHGRGRKHERPIALTAWQTAITRRTPQDLLRGLIHADGCRTTNRFTVRSRTGAVVEYAYPRYFFTSQSRDIRAIFCAHCDLLGIRWTQSSDRNISVAARPSVELLDGFVGPKA